MLIGHINMQGYLDGGISGLRGLKGNKGDKGDKGDTATIAVGSTTTGEAGTDASVVNVGDNHDAVFNFTIPKGDKGAKGDVNTYIASYANDTYSDIGTALSAGKYVVASYGDFYYPLVARDYSTYIFALAYDNNVQTVSCHSDDTWTELTRTNVRLVKQNGTSITTNGVADVIVPLATSTTPNMDGTASAGSETTWAKGDHIHPTDTSRQEVLVSGTNIKTVNENSLLGSGDLTIDAEIDYDSTETYSSGTVGKELQTLIGDIEEILPTDTASGAIASFPDGTNLFPAKSLIADINPIQDLHGYESPWVGGAGVNKWDEQWELGGYSTADGEKAAQTNTIRSTNAIQVTPNGSYYIGVFGTGAIYLFYYDQNGDYVGNSGGYVSSGAKTLPNDAYQLRFQLNPAYGTTYNNDIAINYPSTITTYSPYENICPISGWNSVGVVDVGSNLWDEVWEGGSLNATTGADKPDSNCLRSKNYIPIVAQQNYYFKSQYATNIYMLCYDINKTYMGVLARRVNDNGTALQNAVFSCPKGTHFVRFYATYYTTYANDISINYPSTDTSYHAYNGTTHTTSLGTTVYGGMRDVVSGVLTVTHISLTFDGTENNWCEYPSHETEWCYLRNVFEGQIPKYIRQNNWAISNYMLCEGELSSKRGMLISSTANDKKNLYVTFVEGVNSLADWKTYLSNNPLQLVYELATPTTIQLTPTQVQTLLGTNNIFADSGDVTAEYVADIQKWVEKKTDELNTAILALA